MAVSFTISRLCQSPYIVLAIEIGVMFGIVAGGFYLQSLYREHSPVIIVVACALWLVAIPVFLPFEMTGPAVEISLMTALLRLDGIVVAYQSPHGDTLSPLEITKLKIANNRSEPLLIDGWSIERAVRRDGPWTKLLIIHPSSNLKVYFCAAPSDCELTDIEDKALDLTRPIEGHSDAVGWVTFQCPEYGWHCPYWFLRVSLYTGEFLQRQEVLSFLEMQQGPQQGVEDVHGRFFELVPGTPIFSLDSRYWALKYGD